MKKKLTMMLIMLFIVMFTVNVKASYIGAYSLIEKSEDSRWLYNSMPTSIKRGDIVSVKIILKDAKDLEHVGGYNTIVWDKDAFEIVENDNNMYFTVLNSGIDAYMNFGDENRIILNYYYDDNVPSSNNEQIVEFKFKVKNSAKDGVYKISQMFDSGGVSAYVNDEYSDSYSGQTDLKYQIGKTKIVSIFNKDDIAGRSYVIGKHLFTREGSDEYNGSLTTEHIMLASKTIESNNKDDMIVYFKTAHGEWKNAISDTEITPPTNFDIEYVDMKSSYQENGIFTDSNEKTILSVVQFNDNEAIVSIEDENINVHGIASVNNHVVSLSIKGKNYNITLSDEEAVISTNDTNITNTRLPRRTNYSVNDYYGRKFGGSDSDYNPVAYLRSNQNGKYTFGNKELYFLKTSEEAARICIKDKSSTECEYDEYAYTNQSGYYVVLDESAFVVSTEEQEYGFSWQDNGIRISCEGNCVDNPYVGNYTKESSLTMDDAFHIWEKNYIEYKVTFDFNYDEWIEETYVGDNELLDDYIYYDYLYDMIYDPYRENYKFVEWQLNGHKFDLNTRITGPITLVAVWEDAIATPSLSVEPVGDYYSNYFSIDSLINYCINNCDEGDVSQREYSIDGYEIYIHGNDDNYTLYGVLVPVGNVFSIKSSFLPYEEAQIKVEPNQILNFAIRAYILDENNHKHYSDYSSDQMISTLIPTPEIKFDTLTDSNVDYINYENGEYIYRIYVYNRLSFMYNVDIYKVDGFELLEEKENGGYQYVANMQLNAATEIRVSENEIKKYFVKPYARNSYAELVYGPISNTIIANQHFTVTFNSNGGSIIPAASVMKGNAVVRPTDPQKENYVFGGWKLNGETYDFSTPVTANITLDAVWNERVYACYHNGDNYEWTYTQQDGWVVDENINNENDCHAPVVSSQCYHNGDEYEWTNAPQDGWVVDENIDNESDCHAPVVPTIASCPGCKFMYTTTLYQYGGASNANATEVSSIPSSDIKEDYRDAITSDRKYFVGFTEANGKIDRAFACGIKNNVPFCIEGTQNGSAYTSNKTLLQSGSLWNNTCSVGLGTEEFAEIESAYCDDNTIPTAEARNNGYVRVGVDDLFYFCSVIEDGDFGCFYYNE